MRRMELEDLPANLRAQAERKLRKLSEDQSQKAALKEKSNRGSKYHNVKTDIVVEGSTIRFDSRKEAKRYNELVTMQKAGEIRDLKLQHHFQLVSTYKDIEGNTHRGIEYVADFTYWKGNEFVIEDVKSEITRKNREYLNKKKLLHSERGYKISEV